MKILRLSLYLLAIATLSLEAFAQNEKTGSFQLAVEPSNASVCFWLEEWRCEKGLTLQIGTEYFVYASADGYTPLNERVLLQRDGQLLQITLESAAAADTPLTQSKPDEAGLQDEAPQIAHSTEAKPVAGQLQSFSATVTDETAVQRVTLHYRTANDFWQRLQMTKTGLDDTYMTTIEAEPGQDSIEYFISAIDITGNENRIGDANNALIRKIRLGDPAPADAAGTLAGQPTAEPAAAPVKSGGSSRTWLYVGIGLLLAGAALSGGGDSGGGGETPDMVDGGSTTFTLNLTPPTQ